ncbi:MAG: radical SAM protein, partial [Deltaproteobacteria bacterium]|nr:radical SAM protein [Deltaproteobacteria bacterium]
MSGVRNLELNLGKLCNNRCIFCLDGSAPRESRKWVPARRAAGELERARQEGTTSLGLLGGEPTAHPEILEIVGMAKELGFQRIALTSNGLKLSNPGLSRALVEAGVTRFSLSVHAHPLLAVRARAHGRGRGLPHGPERQLRPQARGHREPARPALGGVPAAQRVPQRRHQHAQLPLHAGVRRVLPPHGHQRRALQHDPHRRLPRPGGGADAQVQGPLPRDHARRGRERVEAAHAHELRRPAPVRLSVGDPREPGSRRPGRGRGTRPGDLGLGLHGPEGPGHGGGPVQLVRQEALGAQAPARGPLQPLPAHGRVRGCLALLPRPLRRLGARTPAVGSDALRVDEHSLQELDGLDLQAVRGLLHGDVPVRLQAHLPEPATAVLPLLPGRPARLLQGPGAHAAAVESLEDQVGRPSGGAHDLGHVLVLLHDREHVPGRDAVVACDLLHRLLRRFHLVAGIPKLLHGGLKLDGGLLRQGTDGEELRVTERRLVLPASHPGVLDQLVEVDEVAEGGDVPQRARRDEERRSDRDEQLPAQRDALLDL